MSKEKPINPIRIGEQVIHINTFRTGFAMVHHSVEGVEMLKVKGHDGKVFEEPYMEFARL